MIGEGVKFVINVSHLASDHACFSGTLCECFGEGAKPVVWGVFGEVFEGHDEELVSYEDGGGCSVFFPNGGLSSSGFVVVHSGQVVVNEGGGVDHFEGNEVLPDGFSGELIWALADFVAEHA